MNINVFLVSTTVFLSFVVGAIALLFLVSPSKGKRLIRSAFGENGKPLVPAKLFFIFHIVGYVCLLYYLGPGSRNAPGLGSPKVTPSPNATPTPSYTPAPTTFKQVGMSINDSISLSPTSVTLANILAAKNFFFTVNDEQMFKKYSEIPLPPDKFEAIRSRFEPVKEELIEAANSQTASYELRSLILLILAKATRFDSPDSHKLLEEEMKSQKLSNRNSALYILSKLPKKKFPLEILLSIEQMLVKIGIEKSDPEAQFQALQALRHFEPQNLPLVETIADTLGNRKPEFLYEVKAGWHSKIKTSNSSDKCIPYQGKAMMDSFTYEFASQLANYSGDINPLLRRLAKSSNATFHHLVFETLLARPELLDRDLPIIQALSKSLGKDATSQLLILILRIKVPKNRESTKKAAEKFFESKAAKACENSAAFLWLRKHGKF